MSRISIIKGLLNHIPKARIYSAAPEGMEIFHSINPFVGDKLVLDGVKLANGRRTLSKELKLLGYKSKEQKQLISLCEQAPELYPQMSALLKDIPSDLLSNWYFKDSVLVNMYQLAKYSIEHPGSIADIKDWGHLLNVMSKGKREIKLEKFLQQDVTDFKTAEKLYKIISKNGCLEVYDIPQIIKESKIPKEELCKIFDNHLKLATEGAGDKLCYSGFRQQLLPVLNKNPKE